MVPLQKIFLSGGHQTVCAGHKITIWCHNILCGGHQIKIFSAVVPAGLRTTSLRNWHVFLWPTVYSVVIAEK